MTTRILCFDIGGSGIKAMRVDAEGNPLGERLRIPTPHPADPRAVLEVMKELALQAGPYDRVSVGFPGVVREGVTDTAVNLSSHWIGCPFAETLEKSLRRPVRVANDADVQGLGVIGSAGVEMVITLGTGVGSSLFVEGVLVPNLELGHHPFRKNETYEEQLGRAAFDEIGEIRWNRRVRKMIALLAQIFNFDALYLGGGNSKKIRGRLPRNVFRVGNEGGLIGGARLWKLPKASTRSRRAA